MIKRSIVKRLCRTSVQILYKNGSILVENLLSEMREVCESTMATNDYYNLMMSLMMPFAHFIIMLYYVHVSWYGTDLRRDLKQNYQSRGEYILMYISGANVCDYARATIVI